MEGKKLDRPDMVPPHSLTDEERRKESDVEALLWRIEELEGKVRRLESKIRAQGLVLDEPLDRDRIIGRDGLERAYAKVVRDNIDCDDCRDATFVVHYFFRELNHHERLHVLNEAEVITTYISNDPVYYQDALNVMKEDREKVSRFYGLAYTAWVESQSMMMTNPVTCKCGEKIHVEPIPVKEQEVISRVGGNIELICPACENRLGVWDGYCWVAYRPGWSVKLDGLLKRKDHIVEANHVCEMCERTRRTKQRWDGRWLCDWCNRLHERGKFEIEYRDDGFSVDAMVPTGKEPVTVEFKKE
jgi:hypothetical protein